MARTPSPEPSVTMSRSPSRTPSPAPEAEACPILIRVFVTKGKHTPLGDLDRGSFPTSDEFQVHAWKHSTLTSLVQQLYATFPAVYRSPAARFAFKHVYVDAGSRGLYRGRELVSFFGRDFLATVATGQTSRGLERDLEDVRGVQVEEKTLESYGFVTGDLLSVAISVPEPRPAPNGTSIRGAFAREREHIQVQREKEWERVHHPPTRPERRAAERPGSTRAPEGDWRADRDRDRGLDRAEPPHLARGGRERGYRRSASPSRREREPWGRRRD